MLAIGAPNNDGNGDRSGHVRVYGKVEDATSLGGFTWEQLGGDIDGEAADDQSGVSVSLSSDGSVLTIAARLNGGNGEDSGHVRVYKKVVDVQSPGGYTWEQLGDDIDGEAAGDLSGNSVSLSSDGSVLAVGAPNNDGNGDRSGHARIYHIGASGVSIGAPMQANAMAPFEVTFTFDRGVTDFNEEDIAVTHATVDNFMTVDASTYTATITPDISTCDHIAINVPAGAAFDVDSNLPNFAAQEMIVEVVDDVPPHARARDITVALDTNGQVILNADQINDGSTDNCGVDVMFIGSNQVISSEGTFDVELVVEDVNGNRASAFAKVRVEAPVTVPIGDDIDGEAAGDLSGGSVSLSSDGSVLAIGAALNDGNGDLSGHVRVYEKVGDALSPGGFRWVQLGGNIDGEAEGDWSGYSVSLSSDGSVLAIGAPSNDGNGDGSGHVRVYKKVEDALSPGGYTWEQIGNDIDGEAAGDGSGWSVSLSSDGSVLAIGADRNDGNGRSSGHVRVYKRDATASLGWRQLGNDIDGEAAGDFSGESESVSLSSDGSVLAIGAAFNDGNGNDSGHVRVYHIGTSVSIEAPVQVNAMGPFGVTFTFDRGVTDFNEEDIVVTHATVDNFTTVDASTYTATITPDISICGHIAINVPAGAAFDVVSNISNLAAQDVIVEVVDDVPPDARARDITVALDTNGQVVLNADQVNDGSTDNCGVDVMFIGSNQVISSEGTFDVELVVEDVNGNRASTFAKVRVEAPVTVSIGNAPPVVEDLSPFTVDIAFNRAVTGFEPGDIEVANATVSDLTGSGSTYTATLVPTSPCDDITIDIPANIAESSATGLPNLAAGQLSIAVVDTIDPTMTCPADVVAHTSDNGTGDCTTTVALGSPVTDDNCSVASVVARVNGTEIDPDTYAFGAGTTMVTWTVSDGSGNTATCVQAVTVHDDEGPMAIAKDITVRLDASGQATIAPGDVDDGSGSGCDNAGPVSLSLDNAVFTCGDVGTAVTVILTAAHGNNSDTATAQVTVEANGNCGLGPLVDFNRGVSPNGDGIGDTLVIEGLERYGNNVVRIYDLNQRLLFSAHYGGPGDAWDGTDKDGMVPVGSYVCVIDYNEPGLGHEAKMIYVNY